MTIAARRTPSSSLQPSPVAWAPVLTLAAATTAGLLALSGRYGHHRDELYFRVLADTPAWGYVDQPPLTPLVARACLELFGDEVWALRVAPAVLTGLLAILLALLAREFGGARAAQVIGLPQAEMVGSLTGPAARLLFVPAQALALGPLLVPVWGAGLVALLRWESLRRVRSLGVAYPVAAGVLLLLGGQFYTVGFLLVLFAAGAVAAQRWLRAVPAAVHRRTGLLTRVLVTGVATSAVVALPVLPVGVLARTPLPLMNPAIGDQIGWPVYARQVADAHRTLPPEDRDDAVVIADNYGEAGALARYGPDLGLPPVVSGHNGWYRLGRPADGVDVAVVVVQGPGAADFLAARFTTCRPAGVLDSGTGVANEEQGTVIRVCRGPRRPWADLWPDFRHVGLSTFCEPCRRLELAGP